MSEPYIGEIRMFGGIYAPQGWALCNGQLLNIVDNEILYALIGTTYGGDGQNTFALPDLRSRIPIHPSPVYSLGTKGGAETVSITHNQMPAHTHIPLAANEPGTSSTPENMIWATGFKTSYAASGTPIAMMSNALSSAGGNQPHDNIMPSLTISYIIALVGSFPSQH